jgi:predicted transcriptional regulator
MYEHYKREEPMLSPSSVGILLSRLVGKGYLRFHLGLVPPGGGRSPHIYSPLVAFEPVMRMQVRRFLDNAKLDAKMVAEVLDSIIRKTEQETAPPAAKRARLRRG